MIPINADHLDFSNNYIHRLHHEQMTEQRMVDYLLSLSPKLKQAYQVMNGLKFTIESRNYLLINCFTKFKERWIK